MPGMFIVFEGIDGSGKTTISNRVAKALRARGLRVEHAREGGRFVSSVTQAIRDMCRDARNLAMVPRTELLLYVARELQLAEEVIAPALERADIVIADRYLYTAEVLARSVRDLPESFIRAIVDVASGGLWPDIAFLIDVDPSVARGRRKVAKLLARDARPASRKGLTGSGLGQHLRQGYLDVATRDPDRWVIVDNSDADLDVLVAELTAGIASAHDAGVAMGIAGARAAATGRNGGLHMVEDIDSPEEAQAAFLGWVDRRARREPSLAAYVLSGLAGEGIDERRTTLAPLVPQVIARGLRGLSDGATWQLRRALLEQAPHEIALSLDDQAAEAPMAWSLRELLAEAAPAEVAISLQGLDDETAWALRADLYARVPDAVMTSLALLESERSWHLRERWLAERGGLEEAVTSYAAARATARSVAGLDDKRAWALRKAAQAAAPVPALGSIRGVNSDRAWRWRERMLRRAPRTVLTTIAGLDDPRAWAMRVSTARHCREALDSMLGSDHPIAWQIREACLDIWPAAVIKSLGVLVNGARGAELLRQALSGFPTNISLLKQATAVAIGVSLKPTVMAA